MSYKYEKLDIIEKDDKGDYVFKESIQKLIDEKLDINYWIILCINFYYYLIDDYRQNTYRPQETIEIITKLNLIISYFKYLIATMPTENEYFLPLIEINHKITRLYVESTDKPKIDQIKYAAIEAIKNLKGIPVAPSSQKPIIILSRNDWGEETKLVTKTYGKIFAVLNMANEKHKGGGVDKGAGAQEENMFRRSDCDLFPKDMKTRDYTKEYKDQISGKTGTAYLDTDEVRVCFKTPELYNANHTFIEGYTYMSDDMFPFYELRSAASDLRQVTVTNNGKSIEGRVVEGSNDVRELTVILEDMRERIISQFNALIEKNIRHVVLSAFGCGAFRHNSAEISNLYIEVINSNYKGNTYGSHFDVISFPIYYPGYGHDNYDGFYDEFKKNTDLNIKYRHNRTYKKVQPYKINVLEINGMPGLEEDKDNNFRRVVMNVRRIHVFTDTLDILKNTYEDNTYTSKIVPIKTKALVVPTAIDENIVEGDYVTHDPSKQKITVESIFNNINITKYGVLCKFKHGTDEKDSNRTLSKQIIVDATGNIYITKNNTTGAGGVSGAIYNYLKITQFGKGVSTDLSGKIGNAKYNRYGKTGVIHVNSPNFKSGITDTEKIKILTECYTNIFMELLKQELDYENLFNFELNLCPISSDIYSGIKQPFNDENKRVIADYTLNSIKNAIRRICGNPNNKLLLSYRVINLCIYNYTDYKFYKETHDRIIKKSIVQPTVVSDELFDVTIKQSLATGDCLYSSIYRALAERPELLDKVNNFLVITNKNDEKIFIQTLRNKIADDLIRLERAPSINTVNDNDIYSQLLQQDEKHFDTVKESFPSWFQSITYEDAVEMKQAEFYKFLADNIRKMRSWAGQIEYNIIQKYLHDLNILIKSVIIYPEHIDKITGQIKKDIPTQLTQKEGEQDIIHLYNNSTYIDGEHYEYFSFTS